MANEKNKLRSLNTKKETIDIPDIGIGMLGYEFMGTFAHSAYHMVEAVIEGTELSPMVATFEDGYRAAVVCDSILKSGKSGKKVRVEY